nr:MAG TPA: hypothetical protein [Caudoviricetes sp.]
MRLAPCPRSGRALCALLFLRFQRWWFDAVPMMVVGYAPMM